MLKLCQGAAQAGGSLRVAGAPRGPSGQDLAARARPTTAARELRPGPAGGTRVRCGPGLAILKHFGLFPVFFWPWSWQWWDEATDPLSHHCSLAQLVRRLLEGADSSAIAPSCFPRLPVKLLVTFLPAFSESWLVHPLVLFPSQFIGAEDCEQDEL